MQLIGINGGGIFGGDSAAGLEQFRTHTGVTFPIGWGRAASYGVFLRSGEASLSPYPLQVLVDGQGRIMYLSREYEPAELRQELERLLP